MVRKQSASKSTGKHISAESPMEIPFTINPRQPHFWSMKFFPERGYKMEKAHPNFKATVEALHWEKFVEHRTHYMEQLVREFYAGLITKSGEILTDHSMVRGVKVMFDEETINKHFDLHYTGNSFDEKLKQYGKKKMEQIKNRVAVPHATWDKASHTEFKLKIRYIIEELGNWHMFINCSIMPTSHNYTLPKDRLIILDCIMTDEEINIGRIINNEIRDCARKTEGFMYFPCLITELCEKQGVKISAAEKSQKKKPPSALSAELKTRRVFKPEELEKEKKVFEKKMKEQVKTEEDEKDIALKRFLLDQHEWIKKKFAEISTTATDSEIPEFPLWIFEKVETEVEKETEKEESTEEEVIKKKKSLKRKKPTKTKGKEKKKGGEMEWIDIESTEEEEEEELEKESDEEENNTTTEGSEQTETDSDLDLSMEDLVRKRKGKDPILEQIIPPHKSPAKQTSPTKPNTPPSTGTTPPPPKETNQSQADVTYEGAEPSNEPSNEPETEPTKETSPTLEQPREKTPPVHDRSTILLPYIVSETGNVQVTEEIPISAEGAETADKPVEAETGAAAPGEAAPEKGKPAIADTIVWGDIQETLNVVVAELAKKKKEDLGNTSKFFKKPTSAVTGEGSVVAGAPVQESVKEPVKEVTTEEPKEKGATEEDATLKDVAETLIDLPAKALEQPKEAEVQGSEQPTGEPTPDEPALGESTPKTAETTPLKTGVSGSKSKKEKKPKAKPTPTRSSSRLRSGAKP